MPIDIASGNVHAEYSELRVAGKVELVWNRRFSNALVSRPPGWWGPGWTNRYQATLTRHSGGFEFFGPDGAITLLPDSNRTVEGGNTISDLRSYVEIFMLDGRYTAQQWSIDTNEVWRYVFEPREGGLPMLLAAIENVSGDGIDLKRDAHGRVLAVRQRRESRELLLTYGPSGLLASVMLQGQDGQVHPVARYEYDERGRLSAALDALDQADSYFYDADNRLSREAAKHGGVASYRYDEKGRCVWQSGLNHYDEKHLRFLEATRMTELTDSRGATYRYQWLPSGQITGEWNPVGGHTRTEYDEFGRVVVKTSPIGASTRYTYDPRGNRCAISNPLGHAFQIEFNEHHQPTAVKDPSGQTWMRQYDAQHRLIASVDPLGGRWEVTYDAHGDAVALTNPNRNTRRCIYETGVLARASDWLGRYTQVQFDAFGRLLKRTDPLGHSWYYRYDPVGNLVQVELPDGGKLRAAYSPAGDVVRMVDAQGRVTVRRYGACRRLLQSVDPNGSTVSYAWGTEPDQLDTVVNERGETHTFSYDEAGRCIEEAGFDGRRIRFSYDQAGRCMATTNGAGQTVRFKRDLLGAIVEQRLPDGEGVYYTYDPQGRLSAAVNSDCEVRFERDPMGRLIRECQGDHSVQYTLDAMGATVRLETDLDLRLDYQLDPNGLWTELQTSAGSAFRFTHDARGQEIERSLPDAALLSQRYDSVGRLARQSVYTGLDGSMLLPGVESWARLPAPADVERSYQYDRSGAVIGIDAVPAGRSMYALDPAERLQGVLRDKGASERYEFDEAGNIVRITQETDQDQDEQTLRYGAGNALVSRNGCLYEHDGQGRLVRKVEDAASQQPRVWTYEWNALDQLRSVTRPDGAVWRYAYDPFSRRISKKGPSEEVRFVWSGHVPIHEISSIGQAPISYVFAQGSFEPIAQIRDGRTYPIIGDHLGTPQEMLDPAGRVVWKSSTTAFGQPGAAAVAGALPGGSATCQIHFPGQWFDTESGLYYSRYRYYDPACGRFISQDPIGLLGGTNPYTYVANPLGWVDPWGLLCQRLAQSLPDGPGIYHIELNGQVYTGSGVNVRGRLSASDHPAAALLNDPNVRVTVYPVNLGSAAGDQRMTNHILRGYEQGVMNSNNNVPLENGSLNQIRAARESRVSEYAQDATNHSASVGTGTVY